MKKTIKVKIRKDGTLESESHGVTGEECLELLDKILGEIADISQVDLTHDYDDENTANQTTESKVTLRNDEGLE